MSGKFDVIAVSMANHRVRIFARNEDLRSADAIIEMAVARRGVDEEFYVTARPGLYNEGDEWNEAADC
jgi:hypothetical protein